MEDFDKLYDELYSSLKREFPVKRVSFSKRGFDIVLSPSDMQNIIKADIVVFNHKSRQYRTFEYVSGNNKDGMIFKCGEITLTIQKE